MPNKDRNIPKRRFKAFENADAWELRKLGECSSLITKGTTPRDKSGVGDVNFVKVENLVNGEILPLQKIQLEEHEGYLKRSQLVENDILFSIAGTLGRTAVVKKSILPANTNQALSIIRGYEFNKNFLVTILRGNVIKEFIKKNPTIGAQPNLSLEQVSNLCFSAPCTEEQSAIGTFFSTLDRQITLHQRKLDKLKHVKQAYLSEMFPAEGERVPKRRFPGFTDDWELRKLGEVMEVTSVKRIHQSDWTDFGVRFLRARDIVAESKNELVTEPLFISQKKYDEYTAISGKVTKGDLLVTGVGTIGVPMLIERNEPIYFKDGNIIWFKNENHIDGKFFYYSFIGNHIQTFIKESAGIGTVGTFTINTGKNTPIDLPIQKTEQKAIGTFFFTLDRQITLHQRKLEKLKNLKKALLNELFV
ncbi:TPA: restriction endonuclease subunit S [Streptococcus suis]